MAHRRTRASTFQYAAQLRHHLTEAEARLRQALRDGRRNTSLRIPYTVAIVPSFEYPMFMPLIIR